MAVGRQAHSLKLTGDQDRIFDEKLLRRKAIPGSDFDEILFIRYLYKLCARKAIQGKLTRTRYLMRNY